MSEELDRWQALAAELGLPSEPKKIAEPAPKHSPRPAAVPEAAAPRPVVEAPSFRAEEPRAEMRSEEPMDLPPITSLDPPHLDPMAEGAISADRLPEGGLPPMDDGGRGESDRPRGRGGRRGQRGGRRGERSDRGEPGERNERSEAPRAPAQPAEGSEPVASDRPAEDRGGEGSRDDRSRRRGGGGGGGGRGRRPERRPEPEPEPEDVLPEEEPVEIMKEDDEDDGPEDNLADLNVPPWSELIASLYRPER